MDSVDDVLDFTFSGHIRLHDTVGWLQHAARRSCLCKRTMVGAERRALVQVQQEQAQQTFLHVHRPIFIRLVCPYLTNITKLVSEFNWFAQPLRQHSRLLVGQNSVSCDVTERAWLTAITCRDLVELVTELDVFQPE